MRPTIGTAKSYGARVGWAVAPLVHAEIILADAAKAHQIIEARQNLNKVVLRP
ncbi:MAG TPA: hypothetical protein VHU91_06940 [Mycobacteriales bacterium]|nr:hypothetical protein [Mycobacteriales bacterium]